MNIWSFYPKTEKKFKRKEDAVNYALNADKPFKHTHGFGYKNPTTHNKPISKEDAIRIMTNNSMIDISEREDCIHLNTYSGMDMY